MKKVLILSGSPRENGNSDLLCSEFAKGAKDAGHQVEKIRVADLNIGYCRGCYACKSSGVCAIKDDMAGLLPKIIDSDVIVLASPICVAKRAKNPKKTTGKIKVSGPSSFL